MAGDGASESRAPRLTSDVVHDPYLIEGTDCLKNDLGITNADELRIREAQHAALRESQLARLVFRRTFDRGHLRFIHRHLFQDVYPWAGDFRDVPINKSGSEFAKPRFLDSEADRILRELHDRKMLVDAAVTDLPARLAYLFGELNALHPFREGNGRVQRLFLSHVLALRDMGLAWGMVPSAEMVAVSVAVHGGNEVPAQSMFERILRPF